MAFGQSTTTVLPLEDELKLQNVRKDVREILVGRPTVTGLPTFKNGIKFGDGTTQTTAGGSFAVLKTTFTRYTGTENTTSTDWVSVAGTTVTLVMGGGRAHMKFNCLVSALATGQGCHMGFLVNGAYIDGETTVLGFAQVGGADNGVAAMASSQASDWEHITESTYSGSTTFVPIYKVGRSGGYQCNINNGTSANNSAPSQVCQMVVVELGN